MTTASSTIYVGNLPPHLDETSLASHFAPFGDIVSISVPATSTPAGKRNKGFGFITFSTPDDALDALDNMNLNAINGRTLSVSLADPNKLKQQAGGAGGRPGRAVWDDEEWLKEHAVEQTQTASAPAEAP
ncbi:related to ribonucleoprotein [Sporisorium reilianum f. sp. reilianum]|uniref:Related to ribonucleoprotein n=1 Tax=Sporisorium reilianum f. sp. reilianum TaxID=72559 RepID=A0A2N8UF83_9BASI|nr:related to ribonucleoprotein [Sporisorium reilianum f. sp. reilianum]